MDTPMQLNNCNKFVNWHIYLYFVVVYAIRVQWVKQHRNERFLS